MRQTLTQREKNKRNLVDNKIITKKYQKLMQNTALISKEYGIIILEPNMSDSGSGAHSP